MKPVVGLVYSRELSGEEPLAMIKPKRRRVYFKLLAMMRRAGWEAWVFSRLTYRGSGIFVGGWRFKGDEEFDLSGRQVTADLVFDRTGGLSFPLEKDPALRVVNERGFKKLAWDKWQAYRKLGKDMPRTFWVGERKNLEKVLARFDQSKVVLKPCNGLMGKGIFIGDVRAARDFRFHEQYPSYIAQEFVDTSGGLEGISLAPSFHDLRVVIVNGQPVYAHVRRPPPDSLINTAHGGEIDEVQYDLVPGKIKKIVQRIALQFFEEFDNPVFSLDFGWGKTGPKIFELNDQTAFPRWHWKARDRFLGALMINFEKKLAQ